MADNKEENIQENNDVNKSDTNKTKKTSSATKKKTPTKTSTSTTKAKKNTTTSKKTTGRQSTKKETTDEQVEGKTKTTKTMKTTKTTGTTKSTAKAMADSTVKSSAGSTTKSTKRSTAKSTADSTVKSTKKTTKKSTTAKSTAQKKNANSKDTKKIEKSKQVKKAKKTDEKIKQIIAEQLNNVDKFKEVVEEPEKEIVKKETPKMDEQQISMQIEKAQKMPKDEKKKIYKNVFGNILFGILISLYFISLGWGFVNINTRSFVTDLKVFSVILLGVTIILFEYAYNKDSGRAALKGVELLVVAIVSLVLLYMYILYQDKFVMITSICSCVAIAYYLIRAISVYIKDKLRWKKTISDVKEIISED